jgi:hypothetical protein
MNDRPASLEEALNPDWRMPRGRERGPLAHRWIEHMDDRSPRRLIRLLLLVPYVGLLWVPFYNARTPALWGFPFFYWYQLIWVPITAALTWLVYRSVRHDD